MRLAILTQKCLYTLTCIKTDMSVLRHEANIRLLLNTALLSCLYALFTFKHSALPIFTHFARQEEGLNQEKDIGRKITKKTKKEITEKRRGNCFLGITCRKRWSYTFLPLPPLSHLVYPRVQRQSAED